jgi:hypothetical protein
MASIFLSHNSIDKPFVEKLSKDLKRLGVNVWFDKWEVKTGDSLLWKINDGITENEYLGIVLTPESVNSSWVKLELDAAMVKQLNNKQVVILPILLRDCTLPLVLAGAKYADFRSEYDLRLSELAAVFGIANTATISENNWRKFTKDKYSNWKKFREQEFAELVTALVAKAREFNWSVWTGGNNQFSLALSARWSDGANGLSKSIPIRLCGRNNAYLLSLQDAWNPNHLNASDYTVHIGNTVNACEEYVWRQLTKMEEQHGRPKGKPSFFTHRFLKTEMKYELIKDSIRKMNWDRNVII